MRNTAPVLKSNCWSWQHTHNCTGDIRNGKIQVCSGGLDTSPLCAGEALPGWSVCQLHTEAPVVQPGKLETLMVHSPPSRTLPASIRYHKKHILCQELRLLTSSWRMFAVLLTWASCWIPAQEEGKKKDDAQVLGNRIPCSPKSESGYR